MKKEANNLALGDYIQRRRRGQDLDIRTDAEHSGFHESYWRKLEAGQYVSPAAKHLQIIAETLSCPLEDLYSLCGYTVPTALPSFAPYLRATTGLSHQDIAVMERVLASLATVPDEHQDRSAA